MMLKQKNETPHVAVFKLPTGEEVICKVIEETSSAYIVSKPLTLAQGQQGLQFVPIMMLADIDKNFEIPKPVIVGQPQADVVTQYESLTSGIALPKSSGKIVT